MEDIKSKSYLPLEFFFLYSLFVWCLHIEYLDKLQRKHSKSELLDMSDLVISPFLMDERFTKSERDLLFKLSSRTVWVKGNFPNAYLNNDMLCELCKLFPCTQAHPLQCPRLKTRIIVDNNTVISENFIHGDVEQQLLYIKIYKQFWDLREELIENMKET